jgi:hypothetical protein
VELLIASTLMLLMLIAAHQALVLATRYHQKLRDSSQIQQETMAVLRKLERSIRNASVESMTTSVDGRALIFLSAETDEGPFDTASDGAARWRRYVCYYLEGQEPLYTLVRKEQKVSLSDVPPTMPDIEAVKSDGGWTRSELSRQVKDIRFSDGVTTTVSVETQSPAQLSNGLNVTTQIHIRTVVQ